MRPLRAMVATIMIAISTRCVLANPIGNLSASIDIVERDNEPWVKLCSDFKLQKCTDEIKIIQGCKSDSKHPCIESYTCIKTIPAEAQHNGGVSSLQVGSHAICKFYHTDDCNIADGPGQDFVGLPVGWNTNDHPSGGLREYDTSICNLWDYTKEAHGRKEHWDNKIRSFFCSGGSNKEDHEAEC
ncbi:hypothetical protein EG328_009115 [Venturia inaequalis]|uniref:Secreted protein n=1 Tax=Venturia inaequalis TaxID=5025 RepID=A0A8H3UAQ3_VENIN|nr:hypothetical protein EG328_009115 [Venturia inaequalis]RDI86517.1 hypothetical protein Vi05172_g3595 [Venturia inaequalis]